MNEIIRKQVCKCTHCGNEAEMMVTCSLPEAEGAEAQAPEPAGVAPHRVLGHATCSHCGNEADLWVDL